MIIKKFGKAVCFFLFFGAVQMIFAQKITVKIASIAPSRSPWDIEQKNMALEWAKITGGQVTLQFYDMNAQGGESGVIRKMRSVRPGSASPIDGAVFTNIGAYELAPKSNILTLCVPFLFRSQDEVSHILSFCDADIGAAIKEQGFVLLGWFIVGWANFMTKEEVRSPEHLKSIKLSVGGFTSPALGRAFKLAGYTTEDIPSEKLMSSARSANGIKGLYSIPMYAYAAQYHKALPYIIETPLCPVMAAFVVSEKTWNAIPAHFKPELLAAVKRTEDKFVGVQAENDEKYMKMMESENAVRVELTADEKKRWEDVLTQDVRAMAADPSVSCIDFDFFKKISSELNRIRAAQ